MKKEILYKRILRRYEQLKELDTNFDTITQKISEDFNISIGLVLNVIECTKFPLFTLHQNQYDTEIANIKRLTHI